MKKYTFITFLILCFVSCSSNKYNKSLEEELIAMARTDQDIREYTLMNLKKGEISKDYMKRLWDSIDISHSKKLKKIIDSYGWPGYSLVGEEGANAAWVIAQHSNDLELQKQALMFLKKAVSNKDANPQTLAYLTDRVKMRQGLHQIYGTQVIWENGIAIPFKIKNDLEVDRRRLSVGLDSLSVFLKSFTP